MTRTRRRTSSSQGGRRIGIDGGSSCADAATAAATPSATASAAPKKDVLCPAGPDLTLTDPDIEAQIRLKLAKKPREPLKMSDLASLTSLNLTKKTSLDELDPCIFPKLVGLKFLYLAEGHATAT